MELGDFTSLAAVYSRSRPGYPAELVDELMAVAGVTAGDPVADLGAGTGLLTQSLAERGLAVTAIEPNAAMRQFAPPLPNVAWRDGTFEATGLSAGSQRWVTAGQAFHWADPPRALPEIRRILPPGRAFSALWNERDDARSEILAWTRAVIARHVPEFEQTYRGRDWSAVLRSTGDFPRVVFHEVRHAVPMSCDRYLELWRSNNQLNVTAGPQRFARLMDELAEGLDRRGVAELNVPYLCRAWTAFSCEAA